MRQILSLLSALISIYMIIISIRIILTWFGGSVKVPELLSRITDPYLNWFRRFTCLHIGYLDLSPVIALAVLSIFNFIFSTIARFGTISLGIILLIILQAMWSIVSFFIIFIFIILMLRLVAYLTNRDIYSVFWRVVDTISNPILYRINRVIFGGRIVNFLTGIIISGLCLALLYFLLRAGVSLLSQYLIKL